MRNNNIILLITALVLPLLVVAQDHSAHDQHSVAGAIIEPQPLLAQAIRLQEALTFLGSSLSSADEKRLKELQGKRFDQETVTSIQHILDPYCLAVVSINPEARVKVERGAAPAKLIQGGWTTFLVKVVNDAGATAPLQVQSPNAVTPLHAPTQDSRVKPENIIRPGEAANRFLEAQVYHNRPMKSNLSGLKLEYAIVQLYSKDAGQREAELGFNIGQGTQDIGFRNTIHVLFDIRASVKVALDVKDEDGSPVMASFLIEDGIERILDSVNTINNVGFHQAAAQSEFHAPATFKGIYPLPSRRVAALDTYPDFFFQPQIYRSSGEDVQLPPGKYKVTFTRGPEYVTQTRELVIPAGVNYFNTSFQLQRWINMSKLGWYSSDHHVHGGGCSHYDSPEEGVPPGNMFRQALGEDVNVSANLAWGPSWYHQKTFFTGKDDPLSTAKNILHNDVEVSGFPSSHAGHLVLLRLKEDDYPGTTKIEEWPSWTLPVLSWAQSQGGVVGYSHSGWGLQPVEKTHDLPNYITPKMDGIGANEYVVAVTQNVVDFYSAGDTPAPWELNMWYHTLNCGFTPRLSGETDFPCIYDERVGLGRSYFKPNGPLSYDSYVETIKKGRSYVTDGRSHIIDFKADGLEAGTGNSQLAIKGKKSVKITARVIANLPEKQDETGASIAKSSIANQPYWHLERARVGTTRKVAVELLVNGESVEKVMIDADGKWTDISFTHMISKSSWVAMRIYPSVHTNPVFILVDGKPIREERSAKWCRNAVDQCWKMKSPSIAANERAAAEEAYEKARKIYDKIIQEASLN
jgi:hypothetical protein